MNFRQLFLYGVFGFFTVVINVVVFGVLVHGFSMYYIPANIIAWVAAVLFAFVTNKIWVFQSRDLTPGVLARESLSFFTARFLTGLFDMAALVVLISFLAVDEMVSKVITNGIVIVSNYVLSRYWVFK